MAEEKYETEIERLRDGHQLSWAKVAKELGLKSPSAARKEYKNQTGRDHSTSILQGKPGRQPGSSGGGGGRKRSRKGGGSGRGVTGKQARAGASGFEGLAGVVLGERNRDNGRAEDFESVFSREDSEHDIKDQITGKRIVVLYRSGSYFTVNEFSVYKVQAFGLSPRGGEKWVQLLDKDQKTRTIVLNAIIGVH